MTFSRRPAPRFNRGRTGAAAGIAGPPPVPSGQLLAVSQAATASFAGTVSSGVAAADVDQDPSKNQTLSTTMRLTGTSSAMSLAAGTGSLTYATNPPAYLITIEPGATTFSIAYDGTVGSNVVTGIAIPVSSTYTVPAGKPGAGNVFTFGATFNAGDTYQCAVASYVTADATGYTFSQATPASQPVLSKDATGYCWVHAGAQTLENASAAVLALGTNDPAHTRFLKIAPTTADLGEDMLVWSQTTGTSGQLRLGKSVTGTGRLTCVGVTDAGSSTGINQTRGVDDLTNGGVVKFCWFGPGSAGGITCTVNDATPNPSAGTWTPAGAVTPTRLSQGATHDNAVRRAYTGKYYRALLYGTQLTGTQITAVYAVL